MKRCTLAPKATHSAHAALLPFLAAFCTIAAPAAGHAGAGSVSDHGSYGLVHLHVDIHPRWDSFWGDQATIQFELLKRHFGDASRILWNATDGHLRIGTVSFVSDRFGMADVLVNVDSIETGCSGGATTDELNGIGRYGNVVFCMEHLNASQTSGFVIAHELGHYVLGLADEYPIATTGRVCGYLSTSAMFGYCSDTHGDCIMESDGAAKEFCAEQNHDLDQDKNCEPTHGDPA